MVINSSQLKRGAGNESTELRELLEKNLELTEKVYKNSRYIKRFVITSQIIGVMKVLLIVVPIIIGIIYLPPLLREWKPLFNQAISAYQELLNIRRGADSAAGRINIKELPPEIQKFVK